MKDALRPHFRALRDALPAPRRQRLSEDACAAVRRLPAWTSSRAVLLYASFGSELDTGPLMRAGWAEGKRIALPRVADRTLTLHEVEAATSLRPNRFGIPEPGPETPLLAPERIGVVVVPGVAFDRRGGRLGYGGGYYDRLLRTIPHVFRVGLAFDVQVVERLPTTHLDVPMDALATESGVHTLPSRTH